MTTRCPHTNISITEFIEGTSEHSRMEGEWSHYNEPGNYNTKLQVYCYDCGHTQIYWRYSKYLPKWLQTALDELGIPYNKSYKKNKTK
jgi:hypothetical protein